LSITDVATFLVSLVFGFGGNVTASSDKSDQKVSENDFIKSFSLHQLKKADNHDTHNYMLPLMDDFRKWGCSESPTLKFWDMLLNAIEIVLQNIRVRK
jgi:hypothetical protein